MRPKRLNGYPVCAVGQLVGHINQRHHNHSYTASVSYGGRFSYFAVAFPLKDLVRKQVFFCEIKKMFYIHNKNNKNK